MSTSGYRAFTPPRIRLRAIPCTDLHQGFHFVTIRASEVGHSPPTVAPACPPAGGCTLCSGEPPPPTSRSSPCATPVGGFAPAPSGRSRSGCSGATAALPPVASPPNGASGTARPPPCSRGQVEQVQAVRRRRIRRPSIQYSGVVCDNASLSMKSAHNARVAPGRACARPDRPRRSRNGRRGRKSSRPY
jgi:hypothetical protein